MKLFDSLIYLGRELGHEPWQHADLAAIQTVLDKYRMGRALLTAFAARALDPAYGNELVFDAAAQDARLVPCPTVLPNAGLEVGDETAYVDGLIERGARCVTFCPAKHGTGYDPRVVGDLFAALEARRLPVAIIQPDLMAVATLAAQYPDLPVILHLPSYRCRQLLPALRSAANLYVSLAHNFAPYRGIETLVEHIGAHRLLYASGFPITEPGAPLGYLLYADLGDDIVEQIAFANMDALVDNVDSHEPRATSDEPEAASFKPQATSCKPEGGEPRATSIRPLAASTTHRSPSTDRLAAAAWSRTPLPWGGIVDMHGHYGKWAGFPIWGGEADDLVAEMDRIGVEKLIVSHQACMTTEVVHGNNQVLEGMRKHPGRILGYATCCPINARMGIDEIRRCLDLGMTGIKLHSGTGFAYTCDGYKPVWDLADAERIPVLLHTWGNLAPLEPLFDRVTHTPILLAHSGSSRPETYVDAARKHPNLFLDPCFSQAPYGMYEYFVRELGPTRVVFGSDTPWMALGQQLGRLLFADIAEEHKRTILIDNPARILEGKIGE